MKRRFWIGRALGIIKSEPESVDSLLARYPTVPVDGPNCKTTQDQFRAIQMAAAKSSATLALYSLIKS